LGHLLAPYQDNSVPAGFPPAAAELEDLKRWQHDLWYRIVVAALADRDSSTNPAAHVAFDRPVASPYHATTPSIWQWFAPYNEGRPPQEQVRPFNFLLAFQIHPMADEPLDEEYAAQKRKRNRRLRRTQKAKPVAPYDPDPLKAATKCFDRLSGKRMPIVDLQTYREALAQYHLFPETKFLNGRHRDQGPTVRRHVEIGITDIHYIGKEANELDEQVFLGFDPEAQPEYGMESGAYAELLSNVRGFVGVHKLHAISQATGISARYLRDIRGGAANVTVATLKVVERAIPQIEAAHAEQHVRAQQLLDWARAECNRMGIRELARRLDTDPANLVKVLVGKRRASRSLIGTMTQTKTLTLQ